MVWKKKLFCISVTGGVAAVTFLALPARFTLFDFCNDKHVKNWYVSIELTLRT